MRPRGERQRGRPLCALRGCRWRFKGCQSRLSVRTGAPAALSGRRRQQAAAGGSWERGRGRRPATDNERLLPGGCWWQCVWCPTKQPCLMLPDIDRLPMGRRSRRSCPALQATYTCDGHKKLRKNWKWCVGAALVFVGFCIALAKPRCAFPLAPSSRKPAPTKPCPAPSCNPAFLLPRCRLDGFVTQSGRDAKLYDESGSVVALGRLQVQQASLGPACTHLPAHPAPTFTEPGQPGRPPILKPCPTQLA